MRINQWFRLRTMCSTACRTSCSTACRTCSTPLLWRQLMMRSLPCSASHLLHLSKAPRGALCFYLLLYSRVASVLIPFQVSFGQHVGFIGVFHLGITCSSIGCHLNVIWMSVVSFGCHLHISWASSSIIWGYSRVVFLLFGCHLVVIRARFGVSFVLHLETIWASLVYQLIVNSVSLHLSKEPLRSTSLLYEYVYT